MLMRPIIDRFEILKDHIVDRDVMDLGCVDSRKAKHDAAARFEYKANLLHKKIAELNPNTLGVDIDPEGVAVLNGQGFKVVVADVETMNLGRQFDTIIAGEIIEHLENCGLFLRNMHRHLKPGGELIISTPNPFYQSRTWKIWKYNSPQVHEEHMNWQCPATLTQLLQRTGFEVADGWWVQPKRSLLKSWKAKFRPYFSHTFMLMARRAA